MTRLVLAATTFALSMVLLTGCGHREVHSTRGPDGSGDWKRISCRRMDKKCYQTARAICPNGYIFTREGGGRVMSSKGSETASSSSGPIRAKELPTEDKWGPEMYSRKHGAILVRCASSAAID